MVMRGIDISNWQNDIDLERVDSDIDFCIVKATEGLGYVDPSCDRHVQQCIELGINWGIYHFARENSPEDEARCFFDNCSNYFGHGVPVLDYETNNANDSNWCERFCSTLHDLSGVWCMVYTSASYLSRFNGSWLPEKCGLWLAGYPYAAKDWTTDEMPYNPSPWPFAAIWQFTSSLRLNGYSGNLDGNIAYMDSIAWAKYANATSPKIQPVLDEKELIRQILDGKWGNDEQRREHLQSSGYDADYIQEKINELYDVAQECIDGKWGNGWNRKQALTGAGYDFETVQTIVNAIMGYR